MLTQKHDHANYWPGKMYLPKRRVTQSTIKHHRGHAVSVIVGMLIMVLIVVGTATVIYAYAGNSIGKLSSSSNNLIANSGSAITEQVKIELQHIQPDIEWTDTIVCLALTVQFTDRVHAFTVSTSCVDQPFAIHLDEATDLGNIRFYLTLSGGLFSNPVDSWLESVSSAPANQATSATFWLNIASGIPASSAITVYMDFQSTSIDFDGVIAGEAPRVLSPTYGQFDNGAQVSLYYNNGGTVSNLNVANGGTVSVSSQPNPYGATTSVVSLTGPGSTTTSSETVAWINTPLIGDNFIAEGWVNIATNLNGLFAVRGSSSSSTTNYMIGDGWSADAASITYRERDNEYIASRRWIAIDWLVLESGDS